MKIDRVLTKKFCAFPFVVFTKQERRHCDDDVDDDEDADEQQQQQSALVLVHVHIEIESVDPQKSYHCNQYEEKETDDEEEDRSCCQRR